MSQNRRWMADRRQKTRARGRVRRSVLPVLLAGLALAAQIVWAEDFEASGSRPSAVPYHDGPLQSAPLGAPGPAAGAEELLWLSVLGAILYGLRVSGLRRTSRSR